MKLKKPRSEDSAVGKTKSRGKKHPSEVIAGSMSPVSSIGMYGVGTPISQQNLTPTFGRTSSVKMASQEMRAKKGKREVQQELMDKFPAYAMRAQKTVRVGKMITVPKTRFHPE
jgi:hypothetical protein